MAPAHIVRSFDEELERLKGVAVQMGGYAERQFEDALQAIQRRDVGLARKVVTADRRLDELESEIDVTVVRMLATRQPVAQDLRSVVAALKIASDLERIGDLAANLAKRSMSLAQVPAARPASSLPRMGRLVQQIMKDVLDAYGESDLPSALEAWGRDEEVDDLYTSLFRETLTYMMEDPRTITACTHILFMAKNIERIGDHATNIAETVHFLVTGKHIRAARPKGSDASFTMVFPDEEQEV